MKFKKILLYGKKHFQLCLAIDTSLRDLGIYNDFAAIKSRIQQTRANKSQK